MKKQLLLLGVTVLLFACSSPLDMKFNGETSEEVIETLKGEIDSIQLSNLTNAITRIKLNENKNLEDMSFSEILEDGNKWQAEQNKLEAERKAITEEAARVEIEKRPKNARLRISNISLKLKNTDSGQYPIIDQINKLESEYLNLKAAATQNDFKTEFYRLEGHLGKEYLNKNEVYEAYINYLEKKINDDEVLKLERFKDDDILKYFSIPRVKSIVKD
ncbi:MAG: hypothetical protein P8P72_03310 [Flavobacteriaceae bacterium]|nr:hypothetical protein [Flavobacteriaceae bacterium]